MAEGKRKMKVRRAAMPVGAGAGSAATADEAAALAV